ncbi:MAG: universal stress protein [Terracidiphilus sp.]
MRDVVDFVAVKAQAINRNQQGRNRSASDSPTNETAFSLALAQASEFGANHIILHVYDGLDSASEASAIFGYDGAAAQNHRLELLAQRGISIGIHCKTVVRAGSVADQILTYLHEGKIDRVIMGAQSPGPVGKLLVGSVAEVVLRKANVPVCIVGRIVLGDHSKAAIGYQFKTGHRERA